MPNVDTPAWEGPSIKVKTKETKFEREKKRNKERLDASAQSNWVSFTESPPCQQQLSLKTLRCAPLSSVLNSLTFSKFRLGVERSFSLAHVRACDALEGRAFRC